MNDSRGLLLLVCGAVLGIVLTQHIKRTTERLVARIKWEAIDELNELQHQRESAFKTPSDPPTTDPPA